MAKTITKTIGQPIDIDIFIRASNVTQPLEVDISAGIVSKRNPNIYTSGATKLKVDKDGDYKVRIRLDTSKCTLEGGYDLKMFVIGYGKTLAERTEYGVVHLYKASSLASFQTSNYELY